MKSPVLLLLFFLVSCANYVDGFHKSIDREEKVGSRRSRPNRGDESRNYWRDRFHPERDKRPVQNPVTLGGRPSSSQDRVSPPVKREYRPQRYNANDFKDGGNGGSLWAGEGNSASLFTYQNNKRSGDIVIINVMENLRNQISAELKRTFPDKPKKKKKSEDDEDGKGKKKVAAAPTPAPNPADDDVDMKVYDKISGTVMEEISQDYILLRGQKEVIFKKEKRSVEVQALVSRKDILENDYVNSDKLLESRVFILRERQ